MDFITLDDLNGMVNELGEEEQWKLLFPQKLYERHVEVEKLEAQEIKDKRASEIYLTRTKRIMQATVAYFTSRVLEHPLVTDDKSLLDPPAGGPTMELTNVLAKSAICQVALPDVKATNAEDILEARAELRDELLEFRAGILKLTWLLYQQVQNKNDLDEIRQEANTLTNTVINGSLLSLENRMRQHKKKGIRRMLFGTGKVLVQATKLFLPSGATEKMISGGKSLFQLATEINSAKLPEDQVATYLYKLKGKLKT